MHLKVYACAGMTEALTIPWASLLRRWCVPGYVVCASFWCIDNESLERRRTGTRQGKADAFDSIFIKGFFSEKKWDSNSFNGVEPSINIKYLIWAGLRHSVPTHLKTSNCPRSEISLILTIDNKKFDVKRNLKITVNANKRNNCPESKKFQTRMSKFQSNSRPAAKSTPSSTWGSAGTLI